MQKINVLILGLFLVMSSCSTFSSFYEPYDSPEERGWNVIRLQEGEEPELFSTSDLLNDINEIMSYHFVSLGSTNYNGPSDDITNKIITQCKKIGATVALYSIEYTDTKYGSSYYEGTGGTYSVDRYDYDVYYFVKFTDDVGFGINFDDLDSQMRQEYKRNTGAYVDLVYSDSPAFYANIVRGDIVIKINDKEIMNAADGIFELYSYDVGDTVIFEILRDREIETITATY